MFKLSAEIEYAYIALLKLGANHGLKASTKLSEIVAAGGLSEKFMLQALANLRRAGLVQSRRGKNGGYALARDPSSISLSDLFQLHLGPNEDDLNRFEIAHPDSFLATRWRTLVKELMASAARITLADALQAERRERAPMYHI